MYKTLNAPAIGIRTWALPQLIGLAAQTGFGGLDFDMAEAQGLAATIGTQGLRDLFAADTIRPATWGLPVSGPQSDWQVDLNLLAAQAKLAQDLGSLRCVTWCPSWSDSRDLGENRAYHVAQLRPVAQVLADHGVDFGLEFLGPKTLLNGHKFGFVRTMPDMLDLAAAIGPNVGLLLDAWHLFTSGANLADLAGLAVTDVVHVHINDAPVGVPFDAVLDNQRHLPLETGVLDLKGFMQMLAAIGYEGPVVTEPFNAALNTLAAQDPAAAAVKVSQAMDQLWGLAELVQD